MRITSKRKKARSQEGSSSIDLNPMLDVIFIMLVFFVVTASFLNESAVDEYSSSAHSLSERSASTFTIYIKQDGRYFIDDRAIAKNAVRAVVVQKLSVLGDDTLVLLAAEPGANVAAYVAAVDAIQQAQAQHITLKILES